MRQSKAMKFKRFAAKMRGKSTRKDGGQTTKPVVPVDPDATEAQVTTECNNWLEAHGCVMDRLNNAAGQLLLPSTVANRKPC